MNALHRFRLCLFFMGLTVAMTSCLTPRIDITRQEILKKLKVGKTTRREVILYFGEPSASFEDDQILTYRIRYNKKYGYFIISPRTLRSYPINFGKTWKFVDYSLVLIFDEHGILKKHQLVPVV